MSKYYVDVQNGSDFTRDLKGLEAKDDAEAQAYARKLLIALARDSKDKPDHVRLSAFVSDKRRVFLFQVDFSLDLNWSDQKG